MSDKAINSKYARYYLNESVKQLLQGVPSKETPLLKQRKNIDRLNLSDEMLSSLISQIDEYLYSQQVLILKKLKKVSESVVGLDEESTVEPLEIDINKIMINAKSKGNLLSKIMAYSFSSMRTKEEILSQTLLYKFDASYFNRAQSASDYVQEILSINEKRSTVQNCWTCLIALQSSTTKYLDFSSFKPENPKIPWTGSMKDAAIEIRKLYLEDEKRPIRKYKDLGDATSEFFAAHQLVKYPKATAKKLYSSVKKAK
jgi:hypothetical protein